MAALLGAHRPAAHPSRRYPGGEVGRGPIGHPHRRGRARRVALSKGQRMTPRVAEPATTPTVSEDRLLEHTQLDVKYEAGKLSPRERQRRLELKAVGNPSPARSLSARVIRSPQFKRLAVRALGASPNASLDARRGRAVGGARRRRDQDAAAGGVGHLGRRVPVPRCQPGVRPRKAPARTARPGAARHHRRGRRPVHAPDDLHARRRWRSRRPRRPRRAPSRRRRCRSRRCLPRSSRSRPGCPPPAAPSPTWTSYAG